MEQTKQSNKRLVQKKNKSVYVNLPPEETGLHEGDVIEFQVLSEGNILLRKMEHIDIKDDSTIKKIFNIFGFHDTIFYKLKDGKEIVEQTAGAM